MNSKLPLRLGFFTLVFICLIFLNWSPCKSQYSPWESFSTAHGLGDVEVYTIFEATMDSSLWFGTKSGVTRYDGNWKNFIIDDTNPARNKVRSIIEYDSENLWLGTEKGIKILRNEKIESRSIPLLDSLTNKIIWVMKKYNRRIWIGTSNGVYYLNQDDSTWNHYYMLNDPMQNNNIYSLEVIDSLAWFGTGPLIGKIYNLNHNSNTWVDSGKTISGASQITDLFKDHQNILWATTLGNKAIFLKMGVWELYDTSLKTNVNAMIQDWDGDFWFATEDNGVMHFDGTQFIEEFTDKKGLPHNRINDVLEDSYRNIWIASQYAGISRFNGTWRGFLVGNSLGDEVRAIERDENNNIWFGKYGNGIYKYDGTKIITISSDDWINAIEKSYDSQLWFGTLAEGIKIFDGNDLKPFPCRLDGQNILSILEDSNKNLWFGTQNNGVYQYNRVDTSWNRYTIKDGLIDSTVNAIYEDHDYKLWFATDSGLSCYDENGMHPFMRTSQRINTIAEDSSGTLLFGTGGDEGGIGVITYNLTTEKIDTIDTGRGLVSNRVFSVLFDSNNNKLWFGTNRGVNSLVRNENKDNWLLYTRQTTGLPDHWVRSILLDLKIEDKGEITDTSSVLWFGTYRGIARYLGESFPPETYILTDKSLTFNSDRPVFDVSGKDNISSRNEISYSYKILQKYDAGYTDALFDGWTGFSFENRIILPPLNNGEYKILVRARDGDGNIDPTPAQNEFKVEQILINPFGREITTSFGDKSVRIYVSPKAIDNEIRIKVYELREYEFLSAYDIVAIHPQIQRFESLFFKKQGVITIKDPAINQEAKKNNHLTIYHIPASKDTTWYPIGGTVNFDDGTITAPITSFGKYALGIAVIPKDDYIIKDFDCQPRVFSSNGNGPAKHTNILFTLGEISNVKIKIYNVAGRLIRNFTDKQLLYPGQNAITWDGTDDQGRHCTSGLYIVCFDAKDINKFKTIAIVNN